MCCNEAALSLIGENAEFKAIHELSDAKRESFEEDAVRGGDRM